MKEQFVCSVCQQPHQEKELILFEDNLYCESCYQENTVTCTSCGRRLLSNDAYSCNGEYYCESCYDNNYTQCASCERTIHYEDALYYDGDAAPYCIQCYEEDGSDDGTIHDYNYKPEPIFYGDGLYLGVELEIDRGGYDAGNADDILYPANRQQEHLYAKYDGSIDDGFELVSHPMTLDYHLHQMPWMEVMKRAVSLGYRSHSTTTCGLHVHCDRNAFGKTYEEQEVVVARILFFIEKHWDELLKFSRRTEYQINRWASRYGFKDTPTAVMKNAKDRDLGRYVCVNLENDYTIEFRLFRGTLRYQTFCATLQLVDEICQKAISLTDKQFQRLTWGQFVSDIPKEKAELIAYLKEKQLYVNEFVEAEEEI